MTDWVRLPAIAAVSLALGCSSEDPLPAPAEGCGFGSASDAATTGFMEPVPVPDSACGAVVTEERVTGSNHVAECSVLRHASNPPSGGDHYDSWAAFRRYDVVVPRGFWVHSLEHGAVVIAHNCDDCADEIAAASALIDELPEDPLCARGPARRRVLMTPDPLLDVPWAIAAWRFTLRTSCFEAEVFRSFAEGRYARGRENTCAEGRTF